MIASNGRRINLPLAGEAVPDGFPFAIFKRGAFDLRRRGGDAPDEVVRKVVAMRVQGDTLREASSNRRAPPREPSVAAGVTITSTRSESFGDRPRTVSFSHWFGLRSATR